ncbi:MULTISPECIES: restriction endonuclease subunit S [Cyanophyceae]|uniref:restriction endonuclease subunit S n=1 Tax=Cyanophyceae TaxID=3028117 RepID=UPI001689F0FA|nr:restriction endonuclease subunit S [Trichocoleus sp. FACHB-69]MBD1930424.1 restriction endonuclease subunit S [Trichocoleus sp. FACHB-69]
MNSLLPWQEVRLGNHVDLLTGFPFKSQQFTDKPNDIPLVKGANVHQGYIDWNTAKRWSASEFSQYKKFQLQPGDVVVAMDRPWIEAGLKYAWIGPNDPKSLLVQRVARLRGANGLLTEYLRYLVGSSAFTDYIKPIVTGINVPHISADQIKGFKFLLPPLPIQRKIAAILSAYDDLIENNTRRIEILEEMVRSLYREWFVNFRFPGHEQVKMVDSELGLVPEGWEVKKLGEVADINKASLKSGEAPEEINYIDISSVSTGKIDKIEPISFSKASSRARRIVKHGDIIWATVRPNRKSYSLILNPIKNLIVSTGFAVITGRKVPYTYLYQALTTDDFVGYLTNNATGSAYPAVNTGDFKNADVLIPPIELMNKFHNIVADIFNEKDNFLRKNANLRQTRDLLLPKLISGEIDVENIGINTGEIAA